MIDLYNKDAILNLNSIDWLSQTFKQYRTDDLRFDSRDIYEGLKHINTFGKLMTARTDEKLKDLFRLYINKIISIKNIMIRSLELSIKFSDIETFILDYSNRAEFEKLLKTLNDPVNFEYYATLIFLKDYLYKIFPFPTWSGLNTKTNKIVHFETKDNSKNESQKIIDKILKNDEELLHEHIKLMKFYYPFICSLFELKELFNGDKNTTIYESLSDDVTYNHLLQCENFIVNKSQLKAKKKFLEAYMRKELPDLYETGAVKIISE